MRWLLTGATGFLGESIARRLVQEGHEVVAYVRNPDPLGSDLRSRCEVVTGSLGDPNTLAQAADGVEVFVHGASVRDHRAAERALRWVNVAGTENALNAAAHAGVRRFIYLSCADVTLANVDRVHWNEDRPTPGPPADAHARSKLLAEELVRAEVRLETVALRPPLTWGPGDRSHLPDFAAEAKEHGGFQLVGNGDVFVAVLFIDHLVDAVLSAASKGTSGRPYYLHDNEFISAREFYGELSAALGLPPPRRGRPYPLGYALARAGVGRLSPTDIIHRGRPTFFDIHRAISDLDFEPRVTLAEGMNATRAWVESLGGVDPLIARRRAPATASSVDDIVQAAGGD